MSSKKSVVPGVDKVKRRTRAACSRCSIQKIKCQGDTPPCRACVLSNHESACSFPLRPRKIVIFDADLKKLEERIKDLESECSRLRSIAALSTSGVREQVETALEPPEELASSPNSGNVLKVDPSLVQNSSCQAFAGALQRRFHKIVPRQAISTFQTSSTEAAIAKANEQDKKHVHLDDKALERPTLDQFPSLPDKKYAIKMVRMAHQYFAKEFGLFSLNEFETRLEETYTNYRNQKPSWLAYLMITFAVGEQFINEAGEKYNVPGMAFFLCALKCFHEPIEEPNLDSVRTLILIAFYSQGLNRMNAVYAYTGLALSTAVAQGIHRRANNAQLSPAEQEARKRIWWTAFLMDSLWASRLGLLPHFNSSDIDIDLPSGDLHSLDKFNPKFLVANAKLALRIGLITREVYGSNEANFVTNVLSNLKSLEDYLSDLEPDLREPPRTMENNRSSANLHLRYNQLIIVTVRPLYFSLWKNSGDQQTKAMEEATLKCVKAAETNVKLLLLLLKSGWFSTFGFLEAQCCFSSILVLLMAITEGKSCPELRTAISLNDYMCEAGNVTAVDNYCRLKAFGDVVPELTSVDRPRKKLRSGSGSSATSERPIYFVAETGLSTDMDPLDALSSDFRPLDTSFN
ncbi:LANO_0A02872g1_1 [Lachancea nothofagi CBS 11611]|uniref:LANO_0A02872g1_1 n=1 Tax=Lachancea nothofagi CBS 11611 TaxID=1266666 RepID=A0A1G4INW0_9SACH|nr:LANO_0A02872g1_1 [Lachancea nothofagi CBS 11611]